MSDSNDTPPTDTPGVDPQASTEQQSQVRETITELRLRKIEQFQNEALASEDCLAANLGAASGSLLRIGVRLEQDLEALAKVSNEAERLTRQAKGIDTLLKLLRQAERFAQLDLRLAAARQAGGPGKPR